MKRTKYKMYIYRFYADGTMSNAKPCAECTRWMKIAECLGVIYDVYYTDENASLTKYKHDCSHQYLPYSTYW